MTNDEHNGRQSENFDRRPEEHLDEADLILYLDKELGREESARIHSHLEWCVPCRGVRDALDTAYTEFATVQRELDEALPPPPRNWASFDARLAGVLEEGSPVAAARSNRIGDAWRKWRRSVPILPWGFATAAAGLLVGYLWFHSAPHAALSFAAIADRVEQHAG